MNYIEQAGEGLRNLYHAKMRSLLALLGVLVGTASVVAMVLGGELATNEALKQFKALGTDLLAVSIESEQDATQGISGKSENITLEEAENLANVDENIQLVAPYTQPYQPVYFNGNSIPAMILGVTDNFPNILHINLAAGRFVSVVDRYNFYCVIGHNVYETIKKSTYKDPIGQQLQIGKNIFTIIGVAEPWVENNFIYASIDDSVLIPLMASTLINKYAAIQNIIMRVTPEADISALEKNLNDAILKKAADKHVNFRSAKELIVKMKKQSDILTVFLGMIGSISLIVGGIGVMNIMLVSVMERRREIGIRLAVGARKSDIGFLFLLEAVMLSLVGGVIGVIIGISIAYIIAAYQNWDFVFFIWPPVVGFTVSVAVGIFFGFYPAYQASRLDPINALRSD